jgi:peroxiredoxin Q/BCP
MSELIFAPGQPFPDFSLPAVSPQSGAASTSPGTSTLSLGDLRGRPFVLFVYPKDATCGCTLEACGFRDLHPQFQELGVQILGLSRDRPSAHCRFIVNQELPYPLLSDASQETMKAWGLIYASSMYGKPVTKVARTTVLVDAAGTVRRVWEGVSPPGHASEVLATCRDLLRS